MSTWAETTTKKEKKKREEKLKRKGKHLQSPGANGSNSPTQIGEEGRFPALSQGLWAPTDPLLPQASPFSLLRKFCQVT